MYIRNNPSSAFSIIEVLVWIFVFSLGLISIYALLITSLSINERNKNAIIASNLAREQVELFRNTRDTNYKKLQVWNQIQPMWSLDVTETLDQDKVFMPWKYYILENDFSWGGVTSNRIIFTWNIDGISEIWAWWNMEKYQLCIDSDMRYVNCIQNSLTNTTPFYRYLYVENVDANGSLLEGNNDPITKSSDLKSIRITSKVIWYKRWYHEFEIQTLVTDWRRI